MFNRLWVVSEVQVLAVRQQGITIAFDEAALLTLQGIFCAAHVIQCIAQMPQDMKLVEQDRRL